MQGAFREKLEAEFAARRAKNARYSLRAFAAFLGADHSSLAQILRGSRPIPAARIRGWARKLGLAPEEAAVYIAAEHVDSDSGSARAQQLRHWTAEALAVMSEAVHFQILQLTREPGFRPDTRWIAERARVSSDEVNIGLARLLRLGLLEMNSAGEWRDMTALEPLTEQGFRMVALKCVRQAAAANGVKLGRSAHSTRCAHMFE
jgi:transcriptional regulator with XRE-family HTH domain